MTIGRGARQYRRKKAAGLCNCGRPHWNGYLQCKKCYLRSAAASLSEDKKAKRRALRKERDEKGLCTRCGGERDDDRKRCRRCREKEVAKVQARRVRNGASRSPKEKKRRSELADARRSAGLCHCGNTPSEGHKTCDRCRRQNKRAHKRYRARKKVQRILDSIDQ